MRGIPYGRQKIEEEDIEAVVRVLKSDFLTQGPCVEQFERSVSEYLKSLGESTIAPHAIAVSSGTSALHLACLALGVKSGDKVIVTSNSFAASANCALYAGANVEFMDISLVDYNIDLQQLEETILNHPKNTFKGIIAVDFAGYPLDLKRLRNICDKNQMWLIEDACHALGAVSRRKTEPIYACADGMYADIATLSFHPVKHVATGEGGMLITRSDVLAENLRMLRTHGITKDPKKIIESDGGWYYEMQALGFNYRISDILCALGTSQMLRIHKNLLRRREIADQYYKELGGLPLILPKVQSDVDHAFHLFVIRTEGGPEVRKALFGHLFQNEIWAQVHYVPIYRHPFYQQRYGTKVKSNCELYYGSCLSIPMHHSLTDSEQAKVIATIRGFF